MALKINSAIDEVNNKIIEAVGKAGFLIEADAKKFAPVQTGNLRASLHTDVVPEEKAAYVGTAVEYAPYVEQGTSKMSAQPFLQPAAELNKQKILDMFEGLI